MTMDPEQAPLPTAEYDRVAWHNHRRLILPWSEVHAAVMSYDEAAVRAAVTAALQEPGGLARQNSMDELDRHLRAAVGDWYGRRCWLVTAETFWRVANQDVLTHEPMFRLEYPGPEVPRPTLDEAVGSVLVRMRVMVDCILAFAAVYAAVDGDATGDARARALSAGFSGVFDVVIERFHCASNWYAYATDGAVWLCDHLGVDREVAETFIDESVTAVCTSWTAPPPPARAALLDAFVARLGGPAPWCDRALVERAERILRPRRERAAAVLAAIEGAREGEAREALVARGLLSADWLDPTRRAFSSLIEPPGFAPVRAASQDPRLYAALAADVEGVARAEALAWEYARRLRAWGLPAMPERLEWCFEGDVVRSQWDSAAGGAYRLSLQAFVAELLTGVVWTNDGTDHGGVFRAQLPLGADPVALQTKCVEAVRAVHAALHAERPRLSPEFKFLAEHWTAAVLWTALVDADAITPDYEADERMWIHDERLQELATFAPQRTPLRDLPDPLATLVALWETGYTVYSVDEEASTIVLFMPRMP